MSLLKWLRKSSPAGPGLPEPGEPVGLTQAANEQVESIMDSIGSKAKKFCGHYHTYSADFRARVGRYAVENSNKAAVKHFSKWELLSESTIRSFKTSYLRELEIMKSLDLVTEQGLHHKQCGRPLALPVELDQAVQAYIRSIRLAGGIVNRSIVIAGARGIILHRNKTLLTEFGGTVDLSKTLAISLMNRMGLVRRKGTKEARKKPGDFGDIKLKPCFKGNKCLICLLIGQLIA